MAGSDTYYEKEKIKEMSFVAGSVLQELLERLRSAAHGHGEGEQGVLEQGRGHPDGREAQGCGRRRGSSADHAHVLSGTFYSGLGKLLVTVTSTLETGYQVNPGFRQISRTKTLWDFLE